MESMVHGRGTIPPTYDPRYFSSKKERKRKRGKRRVEGESIVGWLDVEEATSGLFSLEETRRGLKVPASVQNVSA